MVIVSYQSPLSQIIASDSLGPAIQRGRLERTRTKVRRLFFSLGLSPFITAMCLLVADHPPTFAQGKSMQAEGSKIYDRPFPTISVQLGDVLFAIPEQWVDSKFLRLHKRGGNWSFIEFVNANHRPPPRTLYFDVPPLTLFAVRAGSTVENTTSNIERQLRELSARWTERQPDQNGFWNWKPQEYVQVAATHKRPLDQPLQLRCSLGSKLRAMNNCTVDFYWSLRTWVRYRFAVSDVSESQWAELDRRVLELLQFLDARHSPSQSK